MKRKNIFERAAVLAQNTPVPFFIRQQPRLYTSPLSLQKPTIISFNDLKLITLANQISTSIMATLSKNQRLPQIQKQIEFLKEKRRKCNSNPESAVQVYWGARRSGQVKTYYEAETIALVSDLEYVITTHNIDLLRNEIENIKKEIARDVFRRTEKVLDLSPRERERLLRMLKAKNRNIPAAAFNPDPPQTGLPTAAANKYTVHIMLPIRDEDEFDPDPEIAAFFEEEQARWESNGDGKRGNSGGMKAKLTANEMLQAGMKISKIYGSKGDEEDD